MATINRQDLGPVSAYAEAVAQGFTGTIEEWYAYIAGASTAAQTAVQNAESAAASAETATAAAADASSVAYGMPVRYDADQDTLTGAQQARARQNIQAARALTSPVHPGVMKEPGNLWDGKFVYGWKLTGDMASSSISYVNSGQVALYFDVEPETEYTIFRWQNVDSNTRFRGVEVSELTAGATNGNFTYGSPYQKDGVSYTTDQGRLMHYTTSATAEHVFIILSTTGSTMPSHIMIRKGNLSWQDIAWPVRMQGLDQARTGFLTTYSAVRMNADNVTILYRDAARVITADGTKSIHGDVADGAEGSTKTLTRAAGTLLNPLVWTADSEGANIGELRLITSTAWPEEHAAGSVLLGWVRWTDGGEIGSWDINGFVADNRSPAYGGGIARNLLDFSIRGQSDWTEALQNALNACAGGELFIPEGTYAISGTVVIPSNTTIRGQGRSSLIKLKAGTGESLGAEAWRLNKVLYNDQSGTAFSEMVWTQDAYLKEGLSAEADTGYIKNEDGYYLDSAGYRLRQNDDGKWERLDSRGEGTGVFSSRAVFEIDTAHDYRFPMLKTADAAWNIHIDGIGIEGDTSKTTEDRYVTPLNEDGDPYPDGHDGELKAVIEAGHAIYYFMSMTGLLIRGTHIHVKDVWINDINYTGFSDIAVWHTKERAGVRDSLNISPGWCLQVSGAYRCTIDGCTFEGGGYQPCGVDESGNISFTGCYFGNGNRTGFQVHRGVNRLSLTNCVINNQSPIGHAGITMHGAGGAMINGVKIVNCDIRDSYIQTVMGYERNVQIMNSRITSGGLYYLWMNSSSSTANKGWLISGCEMQPMNGATPYIMTNMTDSIIANCIIQTGDSNPIRATGANVLLTGNMLIQ